MQPIARGREAISRVGCGDGIAREEAFGPVLTVSGCFTQTRRSGWADGTQYGLLGVVWTTDPSSAHRLAAECEALDTSGATKTVVVRL
jgi:aldehyde dehydrogenase (NAD+)